MCVFFQISQMYILFLFEKRNGFLLVVLCVFAKEIAFLYGQILRFFGVWEKGSQSHRVDLMACRFLWNFSVPGRTTTFEAVCVEGVLISSLGVTFVLGQFTEPKQSWTWRLKFTDWIQLAKFADLRRGKCRSLVQQVGTENVETASAVWQDTSVPACTCAPGDQNIYGLCVWAEVRVYVWLHHHALPLFAGMDPTERPFQALLSYNAPQCKHIIYPDLYLPVTVHFLPNFVFVCFVGGGEQVGFS